MKSNGAVRHKLKQVWFRHRSKEIQRRVKRRPCNCAFNRTMDLPSGESVSICVAGLLDKVEWDIRVCDEDYGGLEQARECPVFEPEYTPDEIKEDFKEFIETADRAQVAMRYPDAAALLWVLDEPVTDLDAELEDASFPDLPSVQELSPEQEEEAQEEAEDDPDPELPEPPLARSNQSWWAALVAWLSRIF